MHAVLAAVASLYEDELRPYGRIIRKRLAERAEQGTSPEAADGERLRALCEACPRLRVEQEDGGEFAALLVDRPACFVDIYSGSDPYPEAMWKEAAEHFASRGGGNDRFPGGRYASARALAARRLPFLSGRSLGQVCHIMQLAITQRQLLGYRDGAIVPYSQSTSMRKSHCAQLQQPCAGRADARGEAARAPRLRLACWEDTLRHVQEILENALEKGQQQVPLSNIKRLFRSQYATELSETALGHARLSDLLQDRRFSGVCTVRLQARGYVVVPAGSPRPSDEGARPAPAALASPPPEESPEDGGGHGPAEGCSDSWGPSSDDEGFDESPRLCERRTFLELQAPRPPPRRQRALSCPHGLAQCGKRRCVSAEAEAEQDGEPPAPDAGGGRAQELAEEDGERAGTASAPPAPRVKFCEGEPLALEDAEPLRGCAPLATPSPLCLWQGHLRNTAAPLQAAGAAVQTPSPLPQRRPPAGGERLVVRLAELI